MLLKPTSNRKMDLVAKYIETFTWTYLMLIIAFVYFDTPESRSSFILQIITFYYLTFWLGIICFCVFQSLEYIPNIPISWIFYFV